jgi:hypothetical protein
VNFLAGKRVEVKVRDAVVMETAIRGIHIEATILSLAQDFALAGRILDVDRAAFGLSIAYPDCSLTNDEIRACLIEAAQQCGTAMLVEGAKGVGAAGPAAVARHGSDVPRPSRRPSSPFRQQLLRTASFGTAPRPAHPSDIIPTF